jgi:transposase
LRENGVQKPFFSERQWQKIEPLLPKPKRRRRGRPPKDNRRVLEGILWVLKTRARWRDLPKDFCVSPSVGWKRLRLWEAQGVWLRLWRAFLFQLEPRGKPGCQEIFLDGSFAPAKKRGDGVGKTKRGKGTK